MKIFHVSVLLTGLLVAGLDCIAQSSAPTQGIGSTKCELTDEDYAVYSGVLRDLGSPEDPEEAWAGKDILIADQTARPSKDDIAWSGWGMQSRTNEKPLDETMADFRRKYGNQCKVEAHLSGPTRYALLTGEELGKVFKKGPGGWERFYKQHPRAAGYWDFSRPGYNSSGDEAVLYVGHYCGGLCGTGHLYLLRKSDGKWTVIGRSMLWIS